MQNLSNNTNFVIYKSDDGNTVVILNKDVYIKCIESLLSDKAIFEKVDTIKGLRNVTLNHENGINENVPEDGLRCHPKHHTQFYEKHGFADTLVCYFCQFKIRWND